MMSFSILFGYIGNSDFYDFQSLVSIFFINRNLSIHLVLFHKKNPLFFVLLSLLASLILSLYENSYTTIQFIIYLTSVYLLAIYILYVLLYFWRNLNQSFFSFLSFLFVISQICGLVFIYFKMPCEPIYLANVSYFTALRYILIGLIGIIFLILFIRKKKLFMNPINPFSEIHNILYSWGRTSFLNQFCLFIVKNLIFTKKYRVLYLLFDFVLNIVTKLITLIITINAVFFADDLRWFIFIIPFILVTICLSHIQYYLEFMIEGNSNVIREWVTATPKDGSLIFSLTTEAKNEGLTEIDLPDLSNKWIQLSNLSLFFKYKKYLKLLSLSLSLIQVIFWIMIAIYILFFLDIDTESSFATFLQVAAFFAKKQWTITKRSFSITKPLLAPPRDVSYLRESYQNKLKILSNGDYGIGHPLIGEKLPDGTYRIDGYITHGSSPIPGCTYYGLLSKSIDPNALKTGPQNFVVFPEPIIIDPNWPLKPIKGSTVILEHALVKASLETFIKTFHLDNK